MKNRNLVTLFETGNEDATITLQYDQESNLYVNGKKLITEKKIRLRTMELILAVISTIALSTEAVIQVLLYCHVNYF